MPPQEHDTPECPECEGNRTRPLDDIYATCFNCDLRWKY